MVELLTGRYRVGASIGAGGSARVFRARDQRLGRDVAIKLLDDDAARSADPAARQRFENEARAGARFVHPNAVTVFDAGSDQGRLFLVMELLSGGSLAERLADSGPMESAEVALLGTQIGGALAAGHAGGLLHRDVKPSNILFTDDGTAKLADFGIARRFDEIEESLTDTGMVMGTRQYVSPEQAAGRELTEATDQFSLGVTLFEAVTGTRPPNAVERDPDDVLDPVRLVPTVPSTLASAISIASAVPIDQRFPSMSELVERLALVTGAAGTGQHPDADTATMPAHLRPDRGADPFGRTATLAAGAGGEPAQ
uniref:serine/threonine-protein kinase n=1 Tax=Ilumatobacter nonamiensis TaxID=467093 RepID=UPI000A2F4C29